MDLVLLVLLECTYYFLKQTDNKYLVLKKFNAKVIGLVNSFKTASGSKARGEFRQYRNNTLVKNISYQAPDKTVGSQGTAEGMFSFEEGDVFYFYTPATDGYPQQYGTIIIEDNTVNSISCIKYEPTYYMVRQNTNYLQPSIYSDEEKIIGCWIDGKPIYEKVITVTSSFSVGSSWTKFYNVSSLNIENVIYANLGRYNANGIRYECFNELDCYHNSTDGYLYLLRPSGLGLSCNHGIVCIIRYTKATDEPNSFTTDMIKDYVVQTGETKPYSDEEVINAVNDLW